MKIVILQQIVQDGGKFNFEILKIHGGYLFESSHLMHKLDLDVCPRRAASIKIKNA